MLDYSWETLPEQCAVPCLPCATCMPTYCTLKLRDCWIPKAAGPAQHAQQDGAVPVSPWLAGSVLAHTVLCPSASLHPTKDGPASGAQLAPN